jgi:hypothetical protein
MKSHAKSALAEIFEARAAGRRPTWSTSCLERPQRRREARYLADNPDMRGARLVLIRSPTGR